MNWWEELPLLSEEEIMDVRPAASQKAARSARKGAFQSSEGAEAVRERPILFSAPMVRAILDGSKTMTRRIIRHQDRVLSPMGVKLPFISGDIAWVREAWGHDAPDLDACRRGVENLGAVNYGPYYFADADWATNHTIRKRPSIHMPRWASRITLKVTDVLVQRLQDISDEDAIAEGIQSTGGGRYWIAAFDDGYSPRPSPVMAFMDLWERINGEASRIANPWVYALTFERVKP